MYSRSKERQEFSEDIGEDRYIGADYLSIQELREWLTEVESKGATHISFDSEYDSSSVTAQPVKKWLESDEACQKRVAIEEAQEKERMAAVIKEQEKRDRETYERLKKKFEKPTN